MIMVVARLTPADGKADELLEVCQGLAAQVRAQEPGCQQYQLCRAPDGALVVIEAYADQAALTAHAQSEHVKSSFAKLGACLAGKPQIEILTAVE